MVPESEIRSDRRSSDHSVTHRWSGRTIEARGGTRRPAPRYLPAPFTAPVAVEVGDLEANLLEFERKSFSFDHLLTFGGEEFAIFRRTETETESKLRPKIIHLTVVVPRKWLIYDLAADLLVLGEDGSTPGPRPVGEARETSAESSEFSSQGILFRRVHFESGGYLYVPQVHADALLEAQVVATLLTGD
jgi:hypothetical protein